jgi:hypothetical protein
MHKVRLKDLVYTTSIPFYNSLLLFSHMLKKVGSVFNVAILYMDVSKKSL